MKRVLFFLGLSLLFRPLYAMEEKENPLLSSPKNSLQRTHTYSLSDLPPELLGCITHYFSIAEVHRFTSSSQFFKGLRTSTGFLGVAFLGLHQKRDDAYTSMITCLSTIKTVLQEKKDLEEDFFNAYFTSENPLLSSQVPMAS